MAKSGTAKKEAVEVQRPSDKEFAKADKKQLRAWCDEYEIEWSKTADDEKSLRRKLTEFFGEMEVVEAEEKEEDEAAGFGPNDAKKRFGVDPNTKWPFDCYGWYYEKQCPQCGKCPNKGGCRVLSADAPSIAEAVEAESEAELDEEADELETEEIKASLRKGHAKKSEGEAKSKKGKKVEITDEEPEDEEVEEEDEEAKPSILKNKKFTPKETDNFSVLFDKAHVKEMAGEDEGEDEDEKENNGRIKRFYKGMLATAEAKGGVLAGKTIRKGIQQIWELEGEDLDDTFKELVMNMIKDSELKLAK